MVTGGEAVEAVVRTNKTFQSLATERKQPRGKNDFAMSVVLIDD